VALAALAFGGAAQAASPQPEISYRTAEGTVVIPRSSIPHPGDAGRHAHTNVRILYPRGLRSRLARPFGKYETPGTLACIYGFVAPSPGCTPKAATKTASGGSHVIAIVDAYDYPTARNDISVFSKHFGLPKITADNFQVVYANGQEPDQDDSGGWEVEEALDIEMAHAMAPGAKVILVEAASESTTDLLAAETVAAKLVSAAGGGEVSNSWGASEFAGEEDYEKVFRGANVVFLASAGDSAGTAFPAILPNVVAVGGTTIVRGHLTAYDHQSAWSDTGGGSSAYIDRPGYQSAIPAIAKRVGKKRGAPDIAFEADPDSGVWVYDTYLASGGGGQWLVIGGTSVASPAMAGVLNAAGNFAGTTATELTKIYNHAETAADWTDIDRGICGNNDGSIALPGWDFCTGIGVPNGYGGK
jgi:subtilase family serine protease